MVRTLSQYTKSAPPPAAAALRPVAPLDVRREPTSMAFWGVLNWMLQFMPVQPEEAELRRSFERIGVVPGQPFAAKDEATRSKPTAAGSARMTASAIQSPELSGPGATAARGTLPACGTGRKAPRGRLKAKAAARRAAPAVATVPGDAPGTSATPPRPAVPGAGVEEEANWLASTPPRPAVPAAGVVAAPAISKAPPRPCVPARDWGSRRQRERRPVHAASALGAGGGCRRRRTGTEMRRCRRLCPDGEREQREK